MFLCVVLLCWAWWKQVRCLWCCCLFQCSPTSLAILTFDLNTIFPFHTSAANWILSLLLQPSLEMPEMFVMRRKSQQTNSLGTSASRLHAWTRQAVAVSLADQLFPQTGKRTSQLIKCRASLLINKPRHRNASHSNCWISRVEPLKCHDGLKVTQDFTAVQWAHVVILCCAQGQPKKRLTLGVPAHCALPQTPVSFLLLSNVAFKSFVLKTFAVIKT